MIIVVDGYNVLFIVGVFVDFVFKGFYDGLFFIWVEDFYVF